MRTIFLSVFVCFLSSMEAKSTNYYFSSVSGNDSRSSGQAQNPSTPWKTISRLNSFFKYLKPGDAVLFKRDETFYGSIVITKSGTARSPITISAYGSGARPVITSLVSLSAWKANSNYRGVYDCASSNLGAEVNFVLLNDVLQQIGRYPNSNTGNKGYLNFEGHTGKSSITDKQLPAYPNWTGADVVIRTSHWTLDKSAIKDHSKSRIKFKPLTGAVILRNDYGYFIQNSIKTLDQFGEWYYNPSRKVISMYFGSKSPRSYNIKAPAIDYLIYANRQSYVTFDNLNLKGANSYGFDVNRGSHFIIKNCDILFSGDDGVSVSNHSNFIIDNCTVAYSNNNGISAGSSNQKAIVRNNVIKNTYTIAGMGHSGNGQGTGIRIGDGGLAEYNSIINTGYVGIMMNGNNLIIRNNYIDGFCTVKDDGGAIYTSNGSNGTNSGRKIIGNIILNGIGAWQGTNGTAETSKFISSSSGIYMDDNSNGVEITGNTVENCGRGVLLHNARNIVLKDNTFFNNRNEQVYMKHDWMGGRITRQTVTNNIFFSKLATQVVASFNTVLGDNDIATMGRFDNNYYTRPIDDKLVFFNSTYILSGKEYRVNRDLEGWKSKYRLDASSKRSAKKIAPYSIKKISGSNKYDDGSFNSRKSVDYVWANDCSPTWSNSGMLDGGYLKVVPRSASSSIVLSVGALSSSKKYILKYSLRGSGVMSIGANLRSSDFDVLTPIQYRTVSTNRTENQLLFTPSATERGNGAIVLRVDAKSTYYLDNIQFYEAEAAITNPDDSIRFVYNPSKVSKTVRLDGNYVDVKNNKYPNRIVLQPYASAVLIRNGGTSNEEENARPTVSITNPDNNNKFSGPATISISARATDQDGTISKVAFYSGSTLLATKYSAPYTCNWRNVGAGTYELTARATDNDGLTTTSAKVVVTVTGSARSRPVVSITSPDNNSRFVAPATIYMLANASDKDGTIRKVEFYSGSKLLHTEYNAPYRCTRSNVPAGNYTITAKATDNDGYVTTSAPVSISVGRNKAPTVSIVNPVNNSTYAKNADIYIRVSAQAYSGKVKKVAFYNGNRLLSTQYLYPFDMKWKNVKKGTYTLTAVATDFNDLSATSKAVKISVTSKKNSSRPSLENELAISDSETNEAMISDSPASFKVSPNPVSTTLNISTSGLQQNKPLTISIVSASGAVIKTVASNTSNKTLQLDVSNLQNGVYFVRLICENKLLSQQFVKL